MQEEKKTVRLILRDSVVELNGTPEELVNQIEFAKLLDTVFNGSSDPDSWETPSDYGKVIYTDADDDGVVIPFPQRGRFAHPTYGGKDIG